MLHTTSLSIMHMILFMFFTIAATTNFLFLTEDDTHPPVTKLQQFDSNTFIVRTILNVTIGSVYQCKFDNFNDVYITTTIWKKDVQYLLVKIITSTKTVSLIENAGDAI